MLTFLWRCSGWAPSAILLPVHHGAIRQDRSKTMGWVKDSGVWVLQQADEMSCGLCAVGMALFYFTSVQWQERELKDLSRRVQGADPTEKYSRSAKNISGAQPTVGVQMGAIPDAIGDGTYGNHLAAMIAHEHLQATFGHGGVANVKAALRAVRRAHLVIVRVEWANGAGHWVLVTGRSTHLGRPSTYTIHDPAGCVVQNSGSTTYTAPYATAQFSGYWVEVTGAIRSLLANKRTGVKVM